VFGKGIRLFKWMVIQLLVINKWRQKVD
jgi:hypothetical protein